MRLNTLLQVVLSPLVLVVGALDLLRPAQGCRRVTLPSLRFTFEGESYEKVTSEISKAWRKKLNLTNALQ